METKIISINISPEVLNEEQTEKAGVMWEHNATTLVFNIASEYVGDYRYYLEYRSLLGTKVRTEYLELDAETNTVTYNIPVTMSSLRGVECYFNIVSIDGDGNTVQVIKPHKFCLEFNYSPDTDNSLAKVNDFSVNALLEAIRLGTFKGDKGDKGETGEKGDKGDKGETGEVSLEYAHKNFADAIRKTVSGNPIVVEDVSSVEHSLDIKTTANEMVYVRGKNLIPFDNKSYYNGKYVAGQTYQIRDISFTINEDGSITVKGTATDGYVSIPLCYCSTFVTGIHTVALSGSPNGASASTYCLRLKTTSDATGNYNEYGNGVVVENVDLTGININIIIFNGATVDVTFYPMLEFGDTVTDFVSPMGIQSALADENGNVSELESVPLNMSVFTNTDAKIECTYNQSTAKAIEEIRTELANFNSYIGNLVVE